MFRTDKCLACGFTVMRTLPLLHRMQMGWTPLQWAATKGLKEMALLHLAETSVDCQDKVGSAGENSMRMANATVVHYMSTL